MVLAATSMQLGAVLAENGFVGFVLAEKMGWNKEGTAVMKYTLTTVVGQLGIATGCLFGPKIIKWNEKHNISKILYGFNVLAILVNFLKLVESFYCIAFARLIFGFCSGLLNITLTKCLNDTVPVEVV